MQEDQVELSLDTLREIRGIMDRSARFLSLSGWSGIWAGCIALAGAAVAYRMLDGIGHWQTDPSAYLDTVTIRFLALAIVVFAVAVGGGLFFTYRKAARQNQKMWNNASRMMVLQLFYPLMAGGFFSLAFLHYGQAMFVAPICLAFYGVALISASRYTLSDIRYLGMLEVALGCMNVYFPDFGLFFWALGFGVLHILYGVIMWRKYDKK